MKLVRMFGDMEKKHRWNFEGLPKQREGIDSIQETSLCATDLVRKWFLLFSQSSNNRGLT
jgi:hypothetical protein